MRIAVVLARVLVAAASPGVAGALGDFSFVVQWLRVIDGSDALASLSLQMSRIVPLVVALAAILANAFFDLTTIPMGLAAPPPHAQVVSLPQKASA